MSDKIKNIILGIFIGVVICVGVGFLLFYTDTISFKVSKNNTQEKDNVEKKENDNEKNDEVVEEENKILTESETKKIVVNGMENAVRDFIFKSVLGVYCGKSGWDIKHLVGYIRNTGERYYESTQFTTFAEMDTFVRNVVTDKFLTSVNYNGSREGTDDRGNSVIISDYVEIPGKALYCYRNTGKGYPLTFSETSVEVSDIKTNSFRASVKDFYRHFMDNSQEDIYQYKFEIVKQDGKWLFDSYEEIR